jgi:hypothetical protein
MKKALAIALLALFAVATLAVAHAGEIHSYMGTIAAVHGDGSFTLEKTDGQTIAVAVAQTTRYLYADDHAANPADLKAGSRVVVKMSKDGKTALSVTMAAAKK